MSLSEIRNEVLGFFRAGIDSADPYRIVKNKVNQSGQQIRFGELKGDWDRIHVLSIGKAACKMLKATLDQIPTQKVQLPIIAVTNDENLCDIENVTVLATGHPLPDQRGQDATEVVLKKLKECQPGDLLLLLLSGGGSALLPSPASGLDLADKITLNHILLASGADINEINCVRKHCSTLKGGGLARMAGGADICCLAISDVINDDPSSIASGPTQADLTSYSDAIRILQKYHLWTTTPVSIKQHLTAGAAGLLPETLKTVDELTGINYLEIIASNRQTVESVSQAIGTKKYQLAQIVNDLRGDAQSAAHHLITQFKSFTKPYPNHPIAMLAGGETTVKLKSGSGKGGRNQELALAFALNAEKIGLEGQWCFLSAGTDGRDGPTDAAGGIVDNYSLKRMRDKGINPKKALENHDSYMALSASQDLVITGATGTNVADLQILLWKPIYTSGDQYV